MYSAAPKPPGQQSFFSALICLLPPFNTQLCSYSFSTTSFFPLLSLPFHFSTLLFYSSFWSVEVIKYLMQTFGVSGWGVGQHSWVVSFWIRVCVCVWYRYIGRWRGRQMMEVQPPFLRPALTEAQLEAKVLDNGIQNDRHSTRVSYNELNKHMQSVQRSLDITAPQICCMSILLLWYEF